MEESLLKEMMESYHKPKVLWNFTVGKPEPPKMDNAQHIRVFALDKRTLSERLLRKPEKIVWVCWFEPKDIIPYVYGFLSYYFDAKEGWSEPRHLGHSDIMFM